MSSSDDESDESVKSVTTYHFEDENADVSSFSTLPLLFDKNHAVSSSPLFLRGDADDGLRKIYVAVKAWTFDLTPAIPEISVLTVDKTWIRLVKPRKSFECTVRSVLVLISCLHYLRIKPESSAKSLWGHVNKEFRSYEVKPSQNDLLEHVDVIREAVKRDEALGKCKLLLTFLENPTKTALSEEDAQGLNMDGFIVEDVDDVTEDKSDEEGDDDDELFDSVCAFCDNGGDLLCCEGRCMRSFHATEEAGEESLCDSLGLTAAEVEDIQNFVCKNCKYNKHQCFACGKLGSSDKSSNPEVFRCASAICGYFYHPQCVAKLLYPDDKVASEELRQKIVAGESVTCPIHKCSICKQLEDKKQPELQFAVCRRCPISYHRKCMPREIAFEDDEENGIITRAWEGLLPGRILIYCLKHEINDEIGTPVRNHIKFPSVGVKKVTVQQQNRKRASDFPEGKEVQLLKKKKLSLEGSSGKTSVVKSTKEWSTEKVERSKNILKSSGVDSMRKMKSSDASKKPARENAKLIRSEMDQSATGNGPLSLGNQLYELYVSKTEQVMPVKQDRAGNEQGKKLPVKNLAKKIEIPKLDADSKRSIDKIVSQVASSTTLESVIKKHELPHNTMYFGRSGLDKNVTEGKMQSAIDAVRAALKRLDNGGSIEDAKATCDPAVLNQVFKWKSKLRVYLAPFLHGMRYSSFGRHFTKVEKLQEIVDILHLYVKDGDMIVDFCCGANDFSRLMNKKLTETGKKCSYKNYDLFRPKNDFNFEKRNWMSVEPKELPQGFKLIMGLNPPFGVKASLANKFIDQALSFKPKLLILIVPEETERLDQKSKPYDLVWENKEFLSGKSFYLPGSVDVNDNQMDSWNATPPPLYLWSRSDWSPEHKHIAQRHGHVPGHQNESSLENYHAAETSWPRVDQANVSAPIVIHPMDDKESRADHEKIAVEDHKESSPCSDPGGENKISCRLGTSTCNDPLRKRRNNDESLGRGVRETSLEDRKNGRKPQVQNIHKGMTRDSPPNTVDGRSSLDRPPSTSRSFEIPLQPETAGRGRHHLVDERSSLDHPPARSFETPLQSEADRHDDHHLFGGRSSLDRPEARSFETPLQSEAGRHDDHHFFGGRSSLDRPPARSFETPLQSEAGRHDDHHLFGGRSLDRPPTRSFETPSQAEAAPHGSRHSEHGHIGHARYGTEYGRDWSRLQEEDMGGRFGINGDGSFLHGIHEFSNVNPEPLYAGYPRHGTNSVGFGSHVTELYREPELWEHTDLPYSRIGSAPPVQYGHLPAAPGPSHRMNTSVIDRYAPRLDELNHARMGNIGREPPMFNRSDIYDSGLPDLDYNNIDPLGFPPGPYRPYPHGSTGWLND